MLHLTRINSELSSCVDCEVKKAADVGNTLISPNYDLVVVV